MNQVKRRTLLVAIDAACWEYLDPLLARAALPNIQRLMKHGVYGTLDSPLPPLTPVAWSSLATGKGPAGHGVYEWVRRAPDSYAFVPYTAKDRVGTPFWDRLAEHGIRVGLVNIPLTYPPPTINGFVVCGFGTPEFARRITHPAWLKDEIEGLYETYQPTGPEPPKSDSNPKVFFEAERDFQQQQIEIAIAASEQCEVDVLAINLMLLDHTNHFFPDMSDVEEAVACCDSHLGLLMDAFRPDDVLLISDHGSRRIHGKFLLGSWLADRGYLAWGDRQRLRRSYINWLFMQALGHADDNPRLSEKIVRRLAVEAWVRLPSSGANCLWRALGRRIPLRSTDFWAVPDTDTRTSKVYAGAIYGCLYLNTAGREPTGSVSPPHQQRVLAQLISELSDIIDPDTGEALFSKIYDREALDRGQGIGQPPDLVLDHHSTAWGLSLQLPPPVVPRDGYFVKDPGMWWGEHSRQGIYVFSGKDIGISPKRGSASLLDVPATLLHLYNVPIPKDFDGQVLTQLLKPAFLSACPVRFQPGDALSVIGSMFKSTEEETEEILSRLRSLGYVE